MAITRRNIYDNSPGFSQLILSVVEDDPALQGDSANRYFHEFRSNEFMTACGSDGLGSSGGGYNGAFPSPTGTAGQAFFDALAAISTDPASPSSVTFVNHDTFAMLSRLDLAETLL